MNSNHKTIINNIIFVNNSGLAPALPCPTSELAGRKMQTGRRFTAEGRSE